MIICPDDFRYRNLHPEDGDVLTYDSSKEASNLAWDTCYGLLQKALVDKAPLRTVLLLLVGIPGSGKSTFGKLIDNSETIIFDATFSRRIEREPLIQMAAAVGVMVEAHVFLTPIATCLQRNFQRPVDRRVPYPVMASMLENLRREPVTVEEGFAKVVAHRGS